jgi:transcriptional regulator with XRE-family HTH domain
MSAVPGLRELREEQHLTQAKLAGIAGLPSSSIAHFEAGGRSPSVESLVKLADALGCSADELLGRKVPDHAIAERNSLMRRIWMIRRICENAAVAHRNGVTGRRNIMAVRNDALEKAAQIADAYASREPDDVGAAIASDIRAMLRDIP